MIRREQMAAFDDASQEEFERRLAEHVRTCFAASSIDTSAGDFALSGLSAECVRAMVRHSIQKAKGYGLTWESSIAAYAALMFTVGPRFDEHPEIQAELLDENVPVNSKVDHLGYAISEPTWQEAKAAQGQRVWSEVCPLLVFSRQEQESA